MDIPQHNPNSPILNPSIPERTLWSAVLEQAIKDLDDSEERPKVMAWFRSSRSDEGAFEWICMTLSMEPGKVRQAVLRNQGMRIAA